MILLNRAVVAFGLGIAPDPDVLDLHWQHLSLADLRADLVGSLVDLHAQPPLWNGVIGLASIACDARVDCAARVLHGLHLVLSMGLFLLLYALGRRLLRHRGAAALIALGFSLSPAAIYYENYLFYPQLTAFLFAVFAWALLRWLDDRGLVSLAVLAGALVTLSWTWTLFHPVFVLVVLAAVLVAARPAPRAALIMAAVALLLSLAPAIKNQVRFGFFGAGSWLGLNLSQVAPGGVDGCGFSDYIALHGQPDGHLGSMFNDPRMIAYSAACRDAALERIRAQPLTYARDRLRQVISALSLRPSDYIFDPPNWDRYPILLRQTEIRASDGSLRPVAVATRLGVLGFNLAVLAFMLWRMGRSRNPLERRFLGVMAVFVVLFFGLAHGANGSEQERMRFTIHPLLWLYGCLMLWAAARGLWGRGSHPSPSSGPLPGGGR
ncbi:MAG: hypothetical protein HLUCCA12_03845 [Rhodobacteraceae bacterium HLUCCA12]|nr:MAG: hypothetical protein HLUCCA12_03845 [Rhodobacteraceae bacterium HLUCCA12]